MKTYHIYPPIGIARVGNSEEGYYIGPDIFQRDFVPENGYRDHEGKIKRKGQLFRVYEFQNGVAVQEITADEATITWEVHLVNKKAAKPGLNRKIPRSNMTIDPGAQQVVGRNKNQELQGKIGPNSNRIRVKLGNLLTDDLGRLIVLGGHGHAGSWKASPRAPESVDNRGWFDDTSDGPVMAFLEFENGDKIEVEPPAWVLIGPPDYAYPVVNVVTMYDVAVDKSVPAPLAAPAPSFTDDIYPVLHRTAFLQWTLFSTVASRYGRAAMHGHGLSGAFEDHELEGQFLNPTLFQQMHVKDARNENVRVKCREARMYVFRMLKDPSTGGVSGPQAMGLPDSMPPLEQLTLTATQYEHFRRWSIDDFDDDWDELWDPVEPPQPTFGTISIADRPSALTRASLDACVGGSFAPGIEGGVKMEDPQTYRAPFRIDSNVRAAGDLTEELSVPWQADFNLCTGLWWPGARPVLVIVKEGGNQTTALWTRPHTTEKAPKDRDDYDTIYKNQRMDSNLDMIDFWSGLGFIAKDPSSPDLQYIETERTLPT